MATIDTDLGMSKIRVMNQNSVAGEVVRQLLTFLVSTSIRPGDKLPSERALSERLGTRSLRGPRGGQVAAPPRHRRGAPGRRHVPPRHRLRRAPADPRVGSDPRPATHSGPGRSPRVPRGVRRPPGRPECHPGRRRRAGELHRAHGAMRRRARRGQDFVEADVEFHLRIAEMAGNTVFIDVLRSIRTLLHVWITRAIENEGFEDTVSQHSRWSTRSRAGDPDGGRAGDARPHHLGRRAPAQVACRNPRTPKRSSSSAPRSRSAVARRKSKSHPSSACSTCST